LAKTALRAGTWFMSTLSGRTQQKAVLKYARSKTETRLQHRNRSTAEIAPDQMKPLHFNQTQQIIRAAFCRRNVKRRLIKRSYLLGLKKVNAHFNQVHLPSVTENRARLHQLRPNQLTSHNEFYRQILSTACIILTRRVERSKQHAVGLPVTAK